METKLDTKLVTKLYFYLLQAERSIHKATGNDWSDLKEFYNSERTDAIQGLVRVLKSLLLRHGSDALAFDREEIYKGYPSVGLLKYLFGKQIAGWKKTWSFPDREIRYMTSSLMAVLQMLPAPSKPDLQLLIALRMDLCNCRSIIETRCYGLPVLKYGVRIEHLYQSNWISPVSLADILGEQSQDTRPIRQSA